MDIKKIKLGVIGGGAMAENILRGILTADLVSSDQITVSDIHAQRLNYIKDAFGVITLLDNTILVSQSDIVLLAVKPQNYENYF